MASPSSQLIHNIYRSRVIIRASWRLVSLWGSLKYATLCDVMFSFILMLRFKGSLLSGSNLPLISMVHSKGICCVSLYYSIRCDWYFVQKELAFRSAILYGGLLISNAFGSASIFVYLSSYNAQRLTWYSSWLPVFCQVWRGREESGPGDGKDHVRFRILIHWIFSRLFYIEVQCTKP